MPVSVQGGRENARLASVVSSFEQVSDLFGCLPCLILLLERFYALAIPRLYSYLSDDHLDNQALRETLAQKP